MGKKKKKIVQDFEVYELLDAYKDAYRNLYNAIHDAEITNPVNLAIETLYGTAADIVGSFELNEQKGGE